MRSLPLPTMTTSHVLSNCIAGVNDPALRARLTSIGPSLDATTKSYDVRGKAQTLHLVPRVATVGAVTKDELLALYSNHLSRTNGSARSIYDKIRNAAPNKKCPLCGVGAVAVLDHHLPKSKYPDLSISPPNLIPACHFCNDTKKSRFPKTADEQTLHPYYDGYLSQQWIAATLDHGPPPALIYSVNPSTSWSQVDQKRVKRHFTVCGLAITFTSNANDELIPLKARLEPLFILGGQATVQIYLAEEAASHSGRPNGWQYPMYQTLAADTWFANGGFRLIA